MVLSFTALIVIIVILGLIIAFLYVKDKEMTQTVLYLQNAVEELSNNTPAPLDIESLSKDSKAYKELDAKIYEVGESLIKIIQSIKNLDKRVESLEQKVNKLEEGYKLSLMASSANSNDLDIIAMYKSGKSPEEIAKEKRVPVGEVELIIKLADLNDEQN